MNVLTEADLRSQQLTKDMREYHVSPDVFVTPTAIEYLKARGITLVKDAHVLTVDPALQKSGGTFVDVETGHSMAKKPEDMTHLHGNQLVKKTHPRIVLRGQLDLLEAEVLMVQCELSKKSALFADLDSVMAFLQALMSAEVRDEKVSELTLFGLSMDEIHEQSHDVKKYFGMGHRIADSTMGKTALLLNRLRALVRQTELVAAEAFSQGDNLRIICSLNRLSSAVYILYLRVLSGYYGVTEE